MSSKILNLKDIKKLDVNQLRKIDPERLNLGTEIQDCSLIAQTFERGAHATASEAAAFAPISRSIQNTIAFSKTTPPVLESYLKIPEEDSARTAEQAKKFASDANPDPGGTTGTSVPAGQILQSIKLQAAQNSTYGASFGDHLLDWARDCIPCGDRLLALLEIHPQVNLLGLLEADLLSRLKMLQDIAGLFTNFDQYGDFCQLMSLLSFMCVPDLQRIIALLMALLMLDLPSLDGLIGLLQALILPIFAPILMAITALLDQFVLLVTTPIQCVLDAITQQISKLQFEGGAIGIEGAFKNKSFSKTIKVPSNPLNSQLQTSKNAIQGASQQIAGGLQELQGFIHEAKAKIEAKLDFYLGEIKAMLGELGHGDSAYTLATLRKLKIIRFVGFVTSIISAMAKGHSACSGSGKPPELQEIDSFFNTYVNPNSPFTAYINSEGNLVIDEKQALPNVLPGTSTFDYGGQPIVDTTILKTIQQTNAILSQPGHAVIRCRLETSVQDADKINQYIGELNKL